MHSPEKSQMSRFHLKPNWSCCDFFFTRLKKKIVELISLNALHLRYISTKQKHKNKQTNNYAVTKLHIPSLLLSLCHLSWCSGLAFQFKPRYAPLPLLLQWWESGSVVFFLSSLFHEIPNLAFLSGH